MAIYQRRNSQYWWINIPRGKGQPRLQVSSGTSDENEARIIEQTLKAAMRKETQADKLHDVIDRMVGPRSTETAPIVPLRQAWNAYAASPAVSVAASTLAVRRWHFNRFLEWLATEYPTVADIGTVTPSIAFAYADHLAETTKTGKTYNEHRGNLRHIWKVVARRAGLEKNIWDDTPIASRRDSQSGRAFTPAEVTAILKAAKPMGNGKWHGPSVMALYTGLRQGSIRDLRWGEIRDGWLDHSPPKTQSHGIRVCLPLHSSVQEMLATRTRGADTAKVFPEAQGDHQVSPTFADVLDAAGVDRTGHVTFHCWRHTFRTRLAQAKVAEDAAKRMGGWTSDLNLIYNHDPTQLQDAINSLEPL